MLFNSTAFFALFGVAFLAWHLLRGRARLVALLIASYAFYASWEPLFLLLLLFSTTLDYQVARAMERTEVQSTRRMLLATSVVGNLGVLMYFKYLPLLLATVGLAEWSDAAASQTFHVWGHIPPGLSFYTFQTIGYTIDVYRRKSKACDDPLEFAIFVSFFPQLIAGPIVRADDFLPRLRAMPRATQAGVIQGVELFMLGLFKKLVIADNLGLLLDPLFDDPLAWDGPTMALASILFSAQIYADFSGYSTMARGLGHLFGIPLPRNFDHPWLQGSPLGYRRTWHMTLGQWFRDYVFFPLGGTRHGRLRTYANLLLVWALFGMWHGASWTFGVWGLYNGVVQIAHREFVRRVDIPAFAGQQLVGIVLTALFVMPASLLFRVHDVSEAMTALGRISMIVPGGIAGWEGLPQALAVITAVHVCFFRFYDENLLNRLGWPARWAILGTATVVIAMTAPEQRPFIYFQF